MGYTYLRIKIFASFINICLEESDLSLIFWYKFHPQVMTKIVFSIRCISLLNPHRLLHYPYVSHISIMAHAMPAKSHPRERPGPLLFMAIINIYITFPLRLQNIKSLLTQFSVYCRFDGSRIPDKYWLLWLCSICPWHDTTKSLCCLSLSECQIMSWEWVITC